MTTMTSGNLTPQRNVGKGITRVVLATACLLLVPLIAMQFTREVNWTLFDFIVAACLLAGTGITYVLVASRLVTRRDRTLAGAVLGGALLVVWAELAVGIFH